MVETLNWPTPGVTSAAGALLAACLQPGDMVGLVGDLGAGKTLFTQGVAVGLGLGPDVRVTSPTFTLINEYRGGRLTIYHADLYRLERESELDDIGLDEICRRGDGVVLVEWSDRLPALPRDHLLVSIAVAGPEERRVTVTPLGRRSRELAAAWQERRSEG